MAKRPKNTSKTKAKKKAAPSRPPAKKTSAAKPKPAAKAKPAAARFVKVIVPQHITLDLPPVLHDRLRALSKVMDLPMEAVIRQALSEFADTWEDHHRTVSALAATDDRMQLVVKD
jgi:hypothetical protein